MDDPLDRSVPIFLTRSKVGRWIVVPVPWTPVPVAWRPVKSTPARCATSLIAGRVRLTTTLGIFRMLLPPMDPIPVPNRSNILALAVA